MSSGIATAGAVISAFLTLLERLQTEQDPNIDEGDQSNLNHIIQILALQRAFFEDTILELLFDVLPSADIVAFLKAPDDACWREAQIEAKANKRLGGLAVEFWETCVHIRDSLVDIKYETDNVLISDLAPSQTNYWDPLPLKASILRLPESTNQILLSDLQQNNRELKGTLDKIHQERQLRIQKANLDLHGIASLASSCMSAEVTRELEELCIRVQQEEESVLRELGSANPPGKPSFQHCSSEKAICLAGSTIPYDTCKLLRLRWVLVHLPAPADYEPQRCCWSACPTKILFPKLAAFLVHFLTCKHTNTAEYSCLYNLDCAWYDNRNAWRAQATLPPEREARVKSGLTWPSDYQAFRKRQHVPLEPYEKWTKLETSNAKIDAVMYEGVLLVRKRMNWFTQFELDEHQKESQHLQRLSHFHIIQLFGAYTQPPFYALLLYPLCEYTLSDFMDACEAENTQEVFSNRKLMDRLYLESFFPCLAQALKYIHSHTTRHMDIKPKNILIKERLSNVDTGRRYHIYVADFGTSSSYTDNSQTAAWTGKTLKYCAPEVSPNSSSTSPMVSTWGRPADVFSLGCVYAEMLTVLACKQTAFFDAFRAGSVTLARQELRRAPGHTKDESFQGNLLRVGEWLQSLRPIQDADQSPGQATRGYWYRRGDRLAFAPWRTTFADTIRITESMLEDRQEARPRIAEVLKRFDVDECCNQEIIPLYNG